MKKISTDELKPGMQLSRTVKTPDGEVMYESCILLNEESIGKIKGAGIENVHIIDAADISDSGQALEELVEKGFQESRDRTVTHARSFLQKAAGGQSLDAPGPEATVLDILEGLVADRNILLKLAGINSVDNYLFAHAVNTAALSLLIAMKMDFGEDELEHLGIAGLLADVGMMLVPASTWEHKGRLSSEQRLSIQKHADYSRDILSEMPGIPRAAVDAVYQHHERNDGNGYPEGLEGDEISIGARVLAIADVFAAIREPRVYRQQSGPLQALRAITSSHGFDPQVMRLFLATVSVYPVETIVQLNSGDIGKVVGVKENSPFRPTVEILRDESGRELAVPRRIDLSSDEGSHLYIEEALDSMPD